MPMPAPQVYYSDSPVAAWATCFQSRFTAATGRVGSLVRDSTRLIFVPSAACHTAGLQFTQRVVNISLQTRPDQLDTRLQQEYQVTRGCSAVVYQPLVCLRHPL